MSNTFKINHAAVWVIVVIGQVIPAFWYTIFSEQWLALNGIDPETAQSGGATPFIVSIVASAITAYMLLGIWQNERRWMG